MPRALQAAACSGFTAVSVRGDPRVGQSSTSQPGGSERVLACYSHLHPEQESSGVATGVGHAAPAPCPRLQPLHDGAASECPRPLLKNASF